MLQNLYKVFLRFCLSKLVCRPIGHSLHGAGQPDLLFADQMWGRPKRDEPELTLPSVMDSFLVEKGLKVIQVTYRGTYTKLWMNRSISLII